VTEASPIVSDGVGGAYAGFSMAPVIGSSLIELTVVPSGRR
jgi:hypothetical protein